MHEPGELVINQSRHAGRRKPSHSVNSSGEGVRSRADTDRYHRRRSPAASKRGLQPPPSRDGRNEDHSGDEDEEAAFGQVLSRWGGGGEVRVETSIYCLS